MLAVFNSEKLEKQLVGGRVLTGTIRGKAPFEVLRVTPEGEKNITGHGKILTLQEKKNEIAQAEKGKEIGLLVNSAILLQVGDKLIVKK